MNKGNWITIFPTSRQEPKNHLATSVTMLEQSTVVYSVTTRCGRQFYYPAELKKRRGKRLYADCKVCRMAVEVAAGRRRWISE